MSAQYSREFQIRSGVIEFQNVRFKYPVQRGGKDEEALRGISFKIKPNSKVAIVGGSGAGKSTIFQLLARFYDPTEGQVLIDGQGSCFLPPSWPVSRRVRPPLLCSSSEE